MADNGTTEEEYSLGDLEKDLKKGRPPRRTTWFVVGLVIGVAATIAGPRYLGPYLPGGWGANDEILSGPVLAEERDGDRLLLTIATEPGALIASFSERVAEIAQLVDPGDIVTIAVPDYEPFVENPDFEGVRKRGDDPAAEVDPAADTAGVDASESSLEGDDSEGDSEEDPAEASAAGTGAAAEEAVPDTSAASRG